MVKSVFSKYARCIIRARHWDQKIGFSDLKPWYNFVALQPDPPLQNLKFSKIFQKSKQLVLRPSWDFRPWWKQVFRVKQTYIASKVEPPHFQQNEIRRPHSTDYTSDPFWPSSEPNVGQTKQSLIRAFLRIVSRLCLSRQVGEQKRVNHYVQYMSTIKNCKVFFLNIRVFGA